MEMKGGRHLKVNVSVPNLRLFVGNIPKSKGQAEIMEEFSKVTGNTSPSSSIIRPYPSPSAPPPPHHLCHSVTNHDANPNQTQSNQQHNEMPHPPLQPTLSFEPPPRAFPPLPSSCLGDPVVVRSQQVHNREPEFLAYSLSNRL